ncbi:R-spondin-4 [Cottoperca gobio]|uniref:R-spondin-4 n=1 Tax=Cottoperca gobio TaxID=56716 RepID=A0A6J2PLW5_COTGO|nr:R-spondin-2-like [Cottoperca gobio]
MRPAVDFHLVGVQKCDDAEYSNECILSVSCGFVSFPSFLLSFPDPLRCLTAHRETSEDCRSCLECSRDNGCVRCPERLFLFLQRDGMSHHGTCLHACPAGHYGQRGKDINRCMKCRSLDCEHCFSRDFCTKCKSGFHLYKGKCLSRCPAGTFSHQTDCLEDCLLAPLGNWSDWSVCLRDGVTCGFRWGKQTRTRGAEQSGRTPEEKAASLCPSHSETQRCRMKKKCSTDSVKVSGFLIDDGGLMYLNESTESECTLYG